MGDIAQDCVGLSSGFLVLNRGPGDCVCLILSIALVDEVPLGLLVPFAGGRAESGSYLWPDASVQLAFASLAQRCFEGGAANRG